MNLKILVTGGSGFIGTNVVQFYLDKNIEVCSLDILKPRNSAHERGFTKLDICEKELLVEYVCQYRPTHVIHLAARTDLNGTKLADYAANIIGVENVIESINRCRSVTKTLFASSMLVCEVGYQPRNCDDYKPSTVYGESKVLTEKIVKNHPLIRSEWNIIRPTSIWGPWFGEPYRNFFNVLMRGRFVNIKGVSSTKTFGYVGNAVYQLDQLLFSKNYNMNGKTLYIGDCPPINISEWADEILREMAMSPAPKAPYLFFKMLALFGDCVGKLGVKIPINSFRLRNMTTNNICQLEDLYQAVGVPPYSRAEGIRQTLTWLRKHKS